MHSTDLGKRLARLTAGIAACGVMYEWLSRVNNWRQEGLVSWLLLIALTGFVGVYAVLVGREGRLSRQQNWLLLGLLGVQVPVVSLVSIKYLMFVGLGVFVESSGPSDVYLRASFGGRFLLEIPNRGEVHGIGINVLAALLLASVVSWKRDPSDCV
jgi:hypothetical protein